MVDLRELCKCTCQNFLASWAHVDQTGCSAQTCHITDQRVDFLVVQEELATACQWLITRHGSDLHGCIGDHGLEMLRAL